MVASLNRKSFNKWSNFLTYEYNSCNNIDNTVKVACPFTVAEFVMHNKIFSIFHIKKSAKFHSCSWFIGQSKEQTKCK